MGSEKFFEILEKTKSIQEAGRELDSIVAGLERKLSERLTVDTIIDILERSSLSTCGLECGEYHGCPDKNRFEVNNYRERLENAVLRQQCGCSGKEVAHVG